jgi:2-(1,2-epoxy-1,2-dihydrophenyl)acetyl-CoA isomerase
MPDEPVRQSVRYELAGGAARITLSRPDRGNALDLAVVEALALAVRRARDDDARVVVLQAEGRAFCVGGALDAFAAAPDRGHLVDDLAEALHRVISDLQRMDAIVVTAVQGTAAGAGVPLAAAADIVLAARSARFTLAYTKVGLTPDGGSSLLTASLGLHAALRLALLNPEVTAEQLQGAGLVAAVHSDEHLAAEVDSTVAGLLAGSRSAQVAAKRLFRAVATPNAESALRSESVAIREAAGGPDGREGVDAFLARRAPQFPSATTTSRPVHEDPGHHEQELSHA